MNVLAIEYSSHQRSVGIACGDADGVATVVEIVETGGRAANTFRMVDGVLEQAGLEREQIDCLAVGVGPGSYNGIRSAISTAQGWQLATGGRLLAISSAEAIIAEAVDIGLAGSVAVVINAQRGEYYVAVFDLCPGSEPKQVEELKIVGLQDVLRLESDGILLIGPEIPPGSARFRVVLPRAAVVAKLALKRTDFVAGEAITPIYLRETSFVKHMPTPRS